MVFTAAQLANLLNGKVEGDEDAVVDDFAAIENGKKRALSFLYNPDYKKYLYATQSSIVIVNDDLTIEEDFAHNPTLIRVADARSAFSQVLEAYQAYKKQEDTGIHPSAVIEPDAQIGEHVFVGAQVYVGKGVVIGDNSAIYHGSVIDQGVQIGADTVIKNSCRINEGCIIGDYCIIESGAVLGSDGFGFQPNSENDYKKIIHVGNVVLEDHVSIGANTTIDRATFGSTVIRKGVKLDNLIQVGHNCEIGTNTVVAAQTGIAGSVKIGRDCMIGGQVGFAGHQKIGNGVKIAAQSGIQGDVEDGAVLQGSPAFLIGKFKRSQVAFKSLPELQREVNRLKKEINQIKNQQDSN